MQPSLQEGMTVETNNQNNNDKCIELVTFDEQKMTGTKAHFA
jgi:hypothetical protein